ncbi:MAG: pectate lyase [Caulobacterales bacterium]|nr:pectate lyase [Caulobacterales bacterium]MCA0372489.1 pectate lyase [Pseudomonadota bacterium]
MRKLICINIALFCAFIPIASFGDPTYKNDKIPSLGQFNDAINHYRSKKAKYQSYNEGDFVKIADNIILLQHDNGGWEENLDPSKIFNQDEINQFINDKSKNSGSFDNRNIYSQITYLMNVYEITKDIKYKNAAISGINFTISNQYKNCGGWPHTLPATQSYHDKITIADEVFSGNAQNLRNISLGKSPFASLDKSVKSKAQIALNKADECILRLQIRQNGVLTGWAGQYDKDTLQPSMGRKFELPSIVSQESVEILHYLMNIEKPNKDQILAIESGIAWLKKSSIKGQRLETFKLENKQEFQYHNVDFDRRIVKDENAPLLWARFYDLNDNSIVLANRDSIRVDAYDKINIERRTGYNWYGYWPQKLIDTDYPKWKMRIKTRN